jgi:2-methylaconitate cis-trans-isomerase PrpF
MTDKLTNSTLGDPARFAQSIVARGELWADAEAAADLLEETKGTLLAKLTKEHLDLPAWKAEAEAKGDPRYEEHIKAMVDARRLANLARVRYDGAKAMGEFARSAESTRRAEMQATR